MNDWIQRTVNTQEYQHLLNIFNLYQDQKSSLSYLYQDQKSSLSYFKFPKLENWKWYINTERLIFSCQLLCPIQLARDGIWGFIIFIGDKPLIIATTGENTKIRDKHYDVVNIYLNETSLDTQQCFDLIQEMYPNFYLS